MQLAAIPALHAFKRVEKNHEAKVLQPVTAFRGIT